MELLFTFLCFGILHFQAVGEYLGNVVLSMDELHDDIDGDSCIADDSLGNGSTTNGGKDDDVRVESLTAPEFFPDFPYPNPYRQQISLMRTLYTAAENAHCVVLESPTGTGKSASLLTASIRWLLDHNDRQRRKLGTLMSRVKRLNEADQHSRDDWILTYEQVRLQKRTLVPEVDELTQLSECLDKIQQLKATVSDQLVSLRKACFGDHNVVPVDGHVLSKRHPQDHFYDDSATDSCLIPQGEEFLPESDPAELTQSKSEEQLEEPDGENQGDSLFRIIYCSRTHSQLSQFLDELDKCSAMRSQITVLRLSSRKNLCTNPKVYSLASGDMINEACLDLVQHGKEKCPMRNTTAVKRLSDYLLSGGNNTQVTSAVREGCLTSIFGNFQLHNPGNHQLVASRLGCPYYASRRAMSFAQLVLVPYSTLLLPTARAATGLKLKNSILIIDEAHNLLEATTASLSVLLHASDLRSSLSALHAYQDRYRARLGVLTALRLRQLIHMLRGLQTLIVPLSQNKIPRTSCAVVTVNQMISQAGVDNLSMHELCAFLHEKRFIHKLAGFAKWLTSKQAVSSDKTSKDQPTSRHIPSGLLSLLAGMKRRRNDAIEDLVQVCSAYC